MTVGTIVELTVECLGNSRGTKGVGFNDYGSGCQFIFENGDYDGFSKEEQGLFLKEVGRDDSLTGYRFTNVMRVSEDFQNGVFESALKEI
jgi:hypothetical protein